MTNEEIATHAQKLSLGQLVMALLEAQAELAVAKAKIAELEQAIAATKS